MRFIKLAVTTPGHDRSRPVACADDIWVNLDQIVSIQEQLDSNTFADAVRMGITAEEHYPCLELTLSNGDTHLVSLGVYPDQAAGFEALARFLPALLGGRGPDDMDQLERMLAGITPDTRSAQ
ncbi:hypothetical protein RCH16_003548 [Cryobacterium sp. MP_M5]|uniref:hypothetical protein n=1 Tax=unclassified Cryobacterium TaxID=2649013 RepID=UPI0018CAB6CF|nr:MULTISPECIES: hypothetical protein [unclassified Cryobacterium]MBG6060091.1 hypothetical protein [Cryobacterium sp. MP_M3]MEC5178509.1 hypothetical protein [Cryobacterium sp. MP_M5]